MMLIDFADDDLRQLYDDASFHAPRLGPDVTKAFRKKVGFIAAASTELDIHNMRSLHLEKLVGDRKGQHSIRLNDQWRLILRFESDDAGKVVVILEVVDYH
jgi:toxin HigB-1